jgi:transcriptional regulator with XRE-family HTH domain
MTNFKSFCDKKRSIDSRMTSDTLLSCACAKVNKRSRTSGLTQAPGICTVSFFLIPHLLLAKTSTLMILYVSELCQVYDRLCIMNVTKSEHWLRTLRQRAQLTQEELATRLETEGWSTSRSAVNNWESSKSEPPLSDPQFRQALSNALRVKVRLLLKYAGYEVDTEYHSVVSEQIATLVDQLPADKQELALKLVEQLAGHKFEAV